MAMNRGKLKWWTGVTALVLAGLAAAYLFRPQPLWSDGELKQIKSLWIGSLPPLPPDPSNRVADDPRAADLGREIFFDTRFSLNGYVACATCHRPQEGFQDGRPLGQGVGTSTRRTQSLVGAAYGPWYFWDGRKDSLWSQALAPLENPAEQGGHRYDYARTVYYFYAAEYQTIFGPLPPVNWTTGWASLNHADRQSVTRVFVNIGKAIEAFERTLLPQPALFDRYAQAVLSGDYAVARAAFTADQVAGLRLFLGQGDCALCHYTPLFSDHNFHNTGVPAVADQPPDAGWAVGLPMMLNDEFGCKGDWSDAGPAGGCADRRYLIVGMANQPGAFQTPSLRNVAGRAPFMHAGQFASLEAVLRHYGTAPPAPLGTTELKAVNLTEAEIRQLIAFLGTLSDLPVNP